MADQQDLMDRITEPVVPKEVAKKINLLEQQFIRTEVEQLRKSAQDFRPLFKQRSQIISHPDVQSNFWIRVLSNAPAEIDEFIMSADAAILGSALKNLTVERFELNEKGEGEPRSVRFTFDFNTDEGANPFFENSKLVKEFYWRKQILTTPSGKKRTWDGLVSTPVRINWKKDMDVTKGLLDAACDLAEAEKKQGGNRRELAEYSKLIETIASLEAATAETDDQDEYTMYGESSPGDSFFNFFGYRGGDVTAEESAKATKEEDEKFAKALKGEAVDEDDEDDEDEDEDIDDDFDDIEIFTNGSELAIALAEDLWPNALKYYVQSFDEGPELDEDDFDDDDDEEEEAKDEDEESRPRKKTKV